MNVIAKTFSEMINTAKKIGIDKLVSIEILDIKVVDLRDYSI